MSPKYLFPIVFTSLLASACGTSGLGKGGAPAEAPEGPAVQSVSTAPAAAPAPAGVPESSAADDGFGYQGGDPPPAAAPGEAARAERSFEPAPERERPGLGTTWGETRTSHVSSAPFQRA